MDKQDVEKLRERLLSYCSGWQEGETLTRKGAGRINDLSSDAEAIIRTLQAENERLRDGLITVGHALTCRDGGTHYCPNCDNSLFGAAVAVNAALIAPPSGEEVE